MTGPLALSSFVSRISVEALDRKTLGLGALLGNWRSIVGVGFGDASVPIKLVRPRTGGEGAMLHIAVSPARALEFQHEAPLLLSRINGFFGYRAVEGIKLLQRQARYRPVSKIRRTISAAAMATVSTRVATIGDDDLRASLARLGLAIIGNSPDGSPLGD